MKYMQTFNASGNIGLFPYTDLLGDTVEDARDYQSKMTGDMKEAIMDAIHANDMEEADVIELNPEENLPLSVKITNPVGLDFIILSGPLFDKAIKNVPEAEAAE